MIASSISFPMRMTIRCRRSRPCSSSVFITNSNIRNFSLPTSNTSSRKIRFIRSSGRARKANGRARSTPQRFIHFDETIASIGHEGSAFSYDNEGPRHRALVPAFELASRPVTNGEYLAFIEGGGYGKPEYWLSLGWMTVNEQRWEAPLYWEKRDGKWWNFTLSGFRPVDESEPVTHVSYFEADAFANWSGARLPTEFEWERAAAGLPIDGNFVESETFHPAPAPTASPNELRQMFGDVWEWTRSSYLPYPGYRAAPGALGEYNGKFMCNQWCCAAAPAPLRAVTFARPIAISFNRKNAGNSPASGWHAIRESSFDGEQRARSRAR